MKKCLTLLLFVFCIQVTLSQEITFEDGIAYVDGKPFVKIEKESRKKYIVYDLRTNNKIIEVRAEKGYNERSQAQYDITKLYFIELDKKVAFSEVKIKFEKDVAKLLHEKSLIKYNSALDKELAIEFHETNPVGKRCARTYEKDYSEILYHKYRPVVGKDTLKINEVKYECVTTAFYTRKIMYDQFGAWTKPFYENSQIRYPDLIWENVQLFADDDKKFTVVAKGLESTKTIYASIMIFDENNYDMLAENSVYKEKLVTFFSDGIRNGKGSSKFYKAYWTTFDPERWKQMEEHKRRRNNTRTKSPFSKKPSKPRTVIRNEPKQ